MAFRARFAATTLVLIGALVFSLLGVISSGASVKAGGKIVSASLTKTSFTAAQAKTVKLKCKFSPATKRAVFLLQMKKSGKWTKVRSSTKTGSIKTYTTTVKTLFGSKAVKVGQYRVKISADANSVKRKFTVVKTVARPGAFSKTSPADGATGQSLSATLSWGSSSAATSYEYCIDTTNNSACDGSWTSTGERSASLSGLALDTIYYWQIRARNSRGTTNANGGSWFSFRTTAPLAGHWQGTVSTNSSLIVSYYVLPDQTRVFHFSFSGYAFACMYDGMRIDGTERAITSNSFSATDVDFHYGGIFDSATSASGTVSLVHFYLGCPVPNEYVDAGPYSWTATWQDASQPS